MSKIFRLIIFQSSSGFIIMKTMIQYHEDNDALATQHLSEPFECDLRWIKIKNFPEKAFP